MHHPGWVVNMIGAPGSTLLALADGVVPLDRDVICSDVPERPLR
jgi:hypothetical protein